MYLICVPNFRSLAQNYDFLPFFAFFTPVCNRNNFQQLHDFLNILWNLRKKGMLDLFRETFLFPLQPYTYTQPSVIKVCIERMCKNCALRRKRKENFFSLDIVSARRRRCSLRSNDWFAKQTSWILSQLCFQHVKFLFIITMRRCTWNAFDINLTQYC